MTGDAASDGLDAWSRGHGGIDPGSSRWISGWLRLVHACARPLARRHVPPDAVTAAALLLSVLALLVVSLGDGWPLLATVVVVGAAVLDGVDGAVAVQDGSASRWGEVIDPLADRCSDLLFLACLALLGAPVWWCVGVAVVTLLHESVRSSARSAGMPGVGALTVWERPSRVIVTAFVTGLCGLRWILDAVVGPLPAPLAAVSVDALATGGIVVSAVLAAVGFAHLLVAVRRSLR